MLSNITHNYKFKKFFDMKKRNKVVISVVYIKENR